MSGLKTLRHATVGKIAVGWTDERLENTPPCHDEQGFFFLEAGLLHRKQD
jgi:hypothetical protein